MATLRMVNESEPKGSGYEEVTVGTAAKALAPSAYAPSAVAATIQVVTNPIRVLFDGTNPTSTTGLYYGSGAELSVKGRSNISQFRVIADTTATGSATLRVMYYK